MGLVYFQPDVVEMELKAVSVKRIESILKFIGSDHLQPRRIVGMHVFDLLVKGVVLIETFGWNISQQEKVWLQETHPEMCSFSTLFGGT